MYFCSYVTLLTCCDLTGNRVGPPFEQRGESSGQQSLGVVGGPARVQSVPIGGVSIERLCEGLMVLKLIVVVLLFFLIFGDLGKSAEPARTQNIIEKSVLGLTGAIVFLELPAYPSAVPWPTWIVAVVLGVLAVSSPILGVVEHRLSPDRETYALSRFPMHLITNLLGAGVAAGLLVLERQVVRAQASGFDFSYDFLFNIFLPLSTMTAFVFIRWQQVGFATAASGAPSNVVIETNEAVGSASEAHSRDVPDVPEVGGTASQEDVMFENSLDRWHQLANFLHLSLVIFVVTTTLLHLLAYSIYAAKAGSPLEFTWQAASAICCGLAFLLACGTPWASKDRGVYLTFLTGTPAALSATVMSLAMFQASEGRNIATFCIVLLSYAIYVHLVLRDVKARGEMVERHYYAAFTIAVVLATLLAGFYLAPVDSGI